MDISGNNIYNDKPYYSSSDDSTDNDTCDLTLEDIFINLQLIAKIEVGNKLIQEKKYINIDTSYFKFFTRWLQGVDRNINLTFINNILIKAYFYNTELLKKKDSHSALLLLRLVTDLKNSIIGLINLKHTYSSDKLIQSEIDVMIENIRAVIDNNSKKINFY